MAVANSFLGVGWHWPLAVDATGAFALVSGVEQLDQAIYLVLSTEPGERPMRPEFGCPLRQFVFSPSDATTAGLIAAEVRAALTRWEPRITVEEIAVSTDSDDPSLMWLDVTYAVRATNNRRNLVFPFYVIPPHEELTLADVPDTGDVAAGRPRENA